MKFRGNSTLFQLRSVALISSEIAFTAAYGRKKRAPNISGRPFPNRFRK